MSRRTGIGAARRGPGAVANLPKDNTLAQGRNYDRVRLQDLPEPEDVGEKDGPLDAAELELRKTCDKAIDEWDESTVVLAKALANYRGRKLYRDTHSTYDDWCQWKFKKTRYWALRLEEAYEVTAALMLPAGNTPALPAADDADADADGEGVAGAEVTVERLMPTQHTRELNQAKKEGGVEEMRAVLEETRARGKVTGQALKETRVRRKQARERAEIVDAEIVEDGESPSIDDHLHEAQLMVQELRGAWKRWSAAMKGLEAAGVAGIPLRQDIAREIRRFHRANETDNA